LTGHSNSPCREPLVPFVSVVSCSFNYCPWCNFVPLPIEPTRCSNPQLRVTLRSALLRTSTQLDAIVTAGISRADPVRGRAQPIHLLACLYLGSPVTSPGPQRDTVPRSSDHPIPSRYRLSSIHPLGALVAFQAIVPRQWLLDRTHQTLIPNPQSNSCLLRPNREAKDAKWLPKN
jgi:hypothetical protein